jgi:hypothetical protein
MSGRVPISMAGAGGVLLGVSVNLPWRLSEL